MKDISPNKTTIALTGDFLGFSAQELFDYWTRSDLLVEWWPGVATVEPRVDGIYRFSWPGRDWHITGSYTRFVPRVALGFTWAWDHDVGKLVPKHVDLMFKEIEGGTRLTLEHGPWEETEEAQIERQAVLEGWIHFGMRLAGLRPSEVEPVS